MSHWLGRSDNPAWKLPRIFAARFDKTTNMRFGTKRHSKNLLNSSFSGDIMHVKKKGMEEELISYF